MKNKESLVYTLKKINVIHFLECNYFFRRRPVQNAQTIHESRIQVHAKIQDTRVNLNLKIIFH